MGYQTTKNGVPGYVGDNDVFYPDRGEISGYNDASAQAKSLLALKQAQQAEDALTTQEARLANTYDQAQVAKAVRGVFGQGGSMDPRLAEIASAQEANKGELYGQRRAVDQLRVRQGMDPLYKWKDGLNPAQVSVDPAAGNVAQITPGSRARDAAYVEMAQQHAPNWSQMKADQDAIYLAQRANDQRDDGSVRVTSDMEGYENRADIQAWLDANPGLKERFLADRARKAEAGLLQPNPNVNPDIDEPLWPGPGDSQPPSNRQLAETFLRDRMGPLAGGLERVDNTLEDLAGQLGGRIGREKAKNMPFGDTPVLGDLMQNYGETKGTKLGEDKYNEFKQQFMDRIPASLVEFQRR